MGLLTSPCDNVVKITSMPRWQRDWINNNRSINYSGLVQEMLNEIIKQNDPEYFEENKKFLKQRQVRRKEVIENKMPKKIKVLTG